MQFNLIITGSIKNFITDKIVRSHIGEWLKRMRHQIENELFKILKEKMGSPQWAAKRFRELIEYVEFMKVKVKMH
jgi:hypothetical protein